MQCSICNGIKSDELPHEISDEMFHRMGWTRNANGKPICPACTNVFDTTLPKDFTAGKGSLKIITQIKELSEKKTALETECTHIDNEMKNNIGSLSFADAEKGLEAKQKKTREISFTIEQAKAFQTALLKSYYNDIQDNLSKIAKEAKAAGTLAQEMTTKYENDIYELQAKERAVAEATNKSRGYAAILSNLRQLSQRLSA